MANTTTFPPAQQPKKEVKPNQIVGGALGFFNEFLENTAEDIFRGQGEFVVNEGPVKDISLEQVRQMPEQPATFPSRGSLENFNQPKGAPRKEAELITQYRANIAERIEQNKVSRQDFLIQEAARLEVEGMTEEERNRALGVQTSYSIENTQTAYHIQILRQKKMEAIKRELETEEQAPIPSPAKKDLTMNLEDIEGNSSVSAGAAASGKVG